jgi:CRISPR/Cas system-associated exonuclease Cas4 (RecB family)
MKTGDDSEVTGIVSKSQCDSTCQSRSGPERLSEKITEKSFDEWYREREFTQNIREGTPYFNGPSSIKPPEKHSPSRLLQCHRKAFYRRLNAPEESRDPKGIFWIGSRFEEDIALPFLREAVAGRGEYVTNSQWINLTVETDVGDLSLKGETDPVIVDDDAKPLLLTEIKTKRSVDGLESPNPHHRAQAHAYMKGLTKKHDKDVKDTVILYGGRTDLAIQPFHVKFDKSFWEKTVVAWAETQTSYQLNQRLPPADPEYDWECQFCSYKNRCGEGKSHHSDVDSDGLLSGFDGYPREKVIEYLESHPDDKLTPTLAYQYPELVESYGVADWCCSKCDSVIGWQEVNPNTEPLCPRCAERGEIASLSLLFDQP